MKTILTIFKKEFIDTIRDRRTLITMIVIPLTLFPILMNVSTMMIKSQVDKARSKVLNVALVSHDNAAVLKEMLLEKEDIKLFEDVNVAQGKELIQTDSLHAMIALVPDFDGRIENLRQGALTLFYKSKEDHDIEKNRILDVLNDFEEKLRRERFLKLDLDITLIETLLVEEKNLATTKEQMAGAIGGFLPYIFIIFCFMGCLYPAIDLAAGEKERGTLETLLSTPADRFHIVLGKFGVVALVGLATASIAMLGLYIGIRSNPDLPAELMKTILGLLEWQSIILVILLLLPLAIFFAGIQLSISMFAKSFKEAQSQINPLMVIVIVPAFMGMMPGIELNLSTAWIPVLNVSLATKAIMAGTAQPFALAVVYLSSLVLALLTLGLCSRFVGREEVLFRS